MPRLLLMRHAKAATPYGVPDRERPLADRGRAQAPRVGAYLAAEGLVPDAIVVSPAKRTRETVELVRGALARDVPAREEPRLYEATPATILAVARGLDGGAVLLVGHNPGIGEAARAFAGEGRDDDLAALAARFPTAGLAVIDFPGAEWRSVAPGEGRLDRFVTPDGTGPED